MNARLVWTWRNVWFQTHWLIGISAGIVLAIVGFTGALLSFKEEVLRALNPQVMTVEPAGRTRLSPGELVDRAAAVAPGKRVGSLAISADPRASVRLTVVDESKGSARPGGAPGTRRGAPFYLDPYSGAVLGPERRGEAPLHFIEDVHRRLAAGDSGKLIVGISTALLLVLAGSGIYLRWPRVITSLRTWFTFRWALMGRTFLWHLHAVIGTWVLLLYLLASLTGLYWSFEWYRDGLFAITGAPRPQPAGGRETGGDAPTQTLAPLQITNAWLVFVQTAPRYDTVNFTLPKSAQQPIEMRYLETDSPHERAYNRLTIDGLSGAVLTHERYADKPLGHRLMGSMFALHSGSFFGLAGLLAVMLASLCMPLFAVTGWMMYLKRRRSRAREAEEVAGAAGIEPATR